MSWVVKWGGREWRESDLTVAHLVCIVDGLGGDTFDVSPTKGFKHLVSVLAAFIAVEMKQPFEDVTLQLMTRSATELAEALTLE